MKKFSFTGEVMVRFDGMNAVEIIITSPGGGQVVLTAPKSRWTEIHRLGLDGLRPIEDR